MRTFTPNYPLVFAVLLAVSFQAGSRSAFAKEPIDRSQKKIIKLYGKDRPDPAFVRQNIKAMRDSGLDGICLNVLPDDGIPLEQWGDNGNYLWFGSVELQRKRFARVIADLKATDFGPLTDNFVHAAVRGPATVDWFDEEWSAVLNNARTLGWVIKQGGLKGVTLDVENGAPFFYTEDRRKKHSFQDYVARVRECGRQWISALCQEDPDITLILVYGYWITAQRMERSEIADLQFADYALLPAFIDGLLEGIPPTATIVDGHEDTYPYTCRKTFAGFLSRCRDESLSLSAVPELYRSRMKRALAVWMDYPYYNVAPISTLESSSGEHRTAEEFEHALYDALLLTDRYVWIYNYTNAWWPVSLPTYKDKGITQVPEAYRLAVQRAREPHDPNWAPLPPDITLYADDQLPPVEPVGDEYETLGTLPTDWWFTTLPDVRRSEHFDRFEGWAETFTAGLKESASLWGRIDVRRPWEQQGWPYDGGAWYRVRFSGSAQSAGRRVWLWLPRVFGDVKAYAACEGRGPAVEVRAVRAEGSSGVLIPLTGQIRPGKQTLIAVRVFSAQGPGGIAGSPVLVGRKGERSLAFEGNQLLVDLDLTQTNDDQIPNHGSLAGHASVHSATIAPDEGTTFDGNSGYASLESSGLSYAIDSSITWECTFSPTKVMENPVRFRILMARHPSYMNGLYLDYSSRPNRVAFIQGTGSDLLDCPIEPGNTYHVAATYDGSEMRLYLDGKLVGARRTPVPPPASDSPLLIGGGTSDVPRHAACVVRSVRLYNWALSPAEVAQHATRGMQKGE